MITVEIERDKTRLAEHFRRWKEIFDSGGFEASISPEWSQALLTSHVKEDIYRMLVVRNTQEIVGFVPLVISETKKLGFSIAWLRPLSEYYSTHSDLLLQNVNEKIAGAFVTALYRLEDKWDVFRMNEIVETNPILDPIERHLQTRSIPYAIKTEQPKFYIRLNGTFQEYLQKRSGKLRNNLKRSEKKIGDKGHMECSKYQRQSEWEDGYNQLLYVDEHSWKQGHGTAITSIEKQKRFYRDLCQGASETGRLRIYIFRINHEPAAYRLGFVKGRRYFSLKTSYVEKYRAIGPGTILTARVIEDLFREGFEEFDFTGEPYEGEKQWTEELRWHKSLVIYNRTVKAKLYSTFKKIKECKKDPNDRTVQFRNPEDTVAQS